MKRIINGKRYDTDTAKEVAYYQHLYPPDSSWWRERLYRKATGEYFLHGVGGPMSWYAESDEWEGGERLIPLTLASAKEWAEKHLDADEYEKIFGPVECDDKKTICFRLTETAIDIVKTRAAEAGMPMSEWLEQLIKESRG